MSALGPREHAEIRRFRSALTLDPGVSIHVVVVDTRRVLDEALAEVGVEVARVRPLALRSVDAFEHARGILRAFEEALERAGGRPVVLEAIVSTPATDGAWRRVFASLNETRNHIEQRASGPLIFCVRPELESALGHEAPDLWSKRGSGMRLLDRTPNRVFVSWAADSPEVVTGVEEIARTLTEAGLDVDRDGWPAQASADDLEDIAQERLGRADVVVCVCTPLYRARVDGEAPVGWGPGATWEARAVRHDAYARGPRSDRFVRVLLPTVERAVPAALDAERAIHRWPAEGGRLVAQASATTVHAHLRRAIERTFGDDEAAMHLWANGFLMRHRRESDPEAQARELGRRLLCLRDHEAQRSALARLGNLQGDHTSVDAIAAALGVGALPRTLPWSPIPPSPSPLSEQELAHYLGVVETSYTHRHGLRSTDALHVPLEEIVRIRGARGTQESADAAEAAVEVEVAQARVERRSAPLVTAFEHARELGRRALVLLGDPGSGKSTLLRQVRLKVARDGAETIGLPKGTVPVSLSLRKLRPEAEDWVDFVDQELQGEIPDVRPGFAERLEAYGRLLLLFDGLDEIANAEQRLRVARWIERARRSAPGNYFLISSRYGGYTSDLELDAAVVELHIEPLDDARARRFVTRWCTDRGIAAQATGELLEAISQWRSVEPEAHTLTRSPLMLATICEVYVMHGELPRATTELYEACISVRLQGGSFATELRAVLEDVAWWMQSQGRTRATTAELEPVLSSAFARVGLGLDPLAWLRSIRDEHGLLLGWGIDDYGFVHVAIQQYLATPRTQAQQPHEAG